MIYAYEFLCAALFYSVFCRAVRMGSETRADIRFALQAMGTVAAIGIAVPIYAPGWCPDWFTLSLLASITLVQLVTAYHWKDGVPAQFLNPYIGPDRRGDKPGLAVK